MRMTTSKNVARLARPRTPRWRQERWTQVGGAGTRPDLVCKWPRASRTTWSRAGLEELIAKAISEFEEVARVRVRGVRHHVRLPYNLTTYGPWQGYSRSGFHCGKERDGMVETAARMVGFLRAVARNNYSMIIRLFSRTLGKGMNSRVTTLDIYSLVTRWSPGRLNKVIRKVRDRANNILSAYGLRVSWRAIAQVVSGAERRIGKMAIKACALSITHRLRRCHVALHIDPARDPLAVMKYARGLKSILESAHFGLPGYLYRTMCTEPGSHRDLREASHWASVEEAKVQIKFLYGINTDIINRIASISSGVLLDVAKALPDAPPILTYETGPPTREEYEYEEAGQRRLFARAALADILEDMGEKFQCPYPDRMASFGPTAGIENRYGRFFNPAVWTPYSE